MLRDVRPPMGPAEPPTPPGVDDAAIRCDDCITFHAKAALERGASRAEALEALGMAIYMGAGPAVMYAAHAIEAFDHLQPPKPAD